MAPNEPLKFVSKVKIGEEKFDLARNGRFTLVAGHGTDAYGVPYSVEVDLEEFFSIGNAGMERIRQLLDLLGEAVQDRDAALAGLHRTAEEGKP